MGTSIGTVSPAGNSSLRKAVIKRVFQVFGQLILIGAVLFVSAGALSWVWAWVLMGVILIAMIGMIAILLPGHTEVVAGRSEIGKDTKNWDRWLTRLMIIPTFGAYVVAGLDERFGWTTAWPVAVHIIPAAVVLLTYTLSGWAMATNRFFATTVRIQKEHGHVTVTNGPYRYVRHPGYAAFIVGSAAVPILLGSAWSLIPTAVAVALMVVRTALEDRTLQEELPGYREYASRVRYRLIPGVY